MLGHIEHSNSQEAHQAVGFHEIHATSHSAIFMGTLVEKYREYNCRNLKLDMNLQWKSKAVNAIVRKMKFDSTVRFGPLWMDGWMDGLFQEGVL
jgi:acyl CoA:acetate/3-ketoacid CoA transferase